MRNKLNEMPSVGCMPASVSTYTTRTLVQAWHNTRVLKMTLVVLQRIADKTYGMHKIHANYGRVFSEWSAIERDMADGLQSAGHYMDSSVLV